MLGETGAAHGVHPSRDRVQPPFRDAVLDGMCGEPERQQLTPRHDAVLPSREGPEGLGAACLTSLVGHGPPKSSAKRVRPLSRSCLKGLSSRVDRARRGISGALSPAIRYSRAELPSEGFPLSGPVRRTEASMAGSRAASACESGQIREEAALSDTARAPRISLAGAEVRRARPRTSFEGGCTVRFLSCTSPTPITSLSPAS